MDADVPWTTAPEHVGRIADELGCSDAVTDYAMELAERYDGEVDATPLSIAAGAVYWAGLVENRKVTQRRITDAGGPAAGVITNTYREIATAEGYDVTPREREQSDGGTPDRTATLSVSWPNRGTVVQVGISLVLTVVILLVGTHWVRPDEAAFREAARKTVGPTTSFELWYIAGGVVLAVVVGSFVLHRAHQIKMWLAGRVGAGDRGQLDGHRFWVVMVVPISITVIVVVHSQLQAIDPGEITHLCNGLFGCSGPPWWWLPTMLAFLAVVLFLITYLARQGEPEGNDLA